ncbi:MAG: HEPN domain-containing protein [Clostridia bacterium]|nr:HEPN domain-containing protein [Clostridia bacterium]
MAKYRLEKAKNDLSAAKIIAEQGYYEVAANRSYYAIFHAARAVLALTEQDFRKHSGVIAFFRKEYVKTGIFEKRLSDIIQDAFEIRTDCDYEDFYVVAKEDVEQQIANAEYFIIQIENYLQSVISE